MIEAPPTIDFLVAWLTTGCQLRCRYCYMRGGDVARVDLDPGLFARALETLPLRAGGVLQIAGGEPTLVPDVLKEVVSLAWGAGFGRVLVQTNGLGIDDRFVKLVHDRHLSVGISLDGPPDVNDALRGRTAEVLAGMKRLDDAGIPFGVTAVVTRGSIAALPRLAMLLAGFSHARTIGLDIVRPAGRGGAVELPSKADVTGAYRELRAALNWINRRRDYPIVLREDAMVWCGGSTPYCPAERGAAAVLIPSGQLFPCASVAGDPRYDCGTAERPDLDALSRGLRAPGDGCAKCTVVGCRGRCPATALLSSRASALDCALRHATDRTSTERAHA